MNRLTVDQLDHLATKGITASIYLTDEVLGRILLCSPYMWLNQRGTRWVRLPSDFDPHTTKESIKHEIDRAITTSIEHKPWAIENITIVAPTGATGLGTHLRHPVPAHSYPDS